MLGRRADPQAARGRRRAPAGRGAVRATPACAASTPRVGRTAEGASTAATASCSPRTRPCRRASAAWCSPASRTTRRRWRTLDADGVFRSGAGRRPPSAPGTTAASPPRAPSAAASCSPAWRRACWTRPRPPARPTPPSAASPTSSQRLSSGVQVQSLFLAQPKLFELVVEVMAFAPRLADDPGAPAGGARRHAGPRLLRAARPAARTSGASARRPWHARRRLRGGHGRRAPRPSRAGLPHRRAGDERRRRAPTRPAAPSPTWPTPASAPWRRPPWPRPSGSAAPSPARWRWSRWASAARAR